MTAVYDEFDIAIVGRKLPCDQPDERIKDELPTGWENQQQTLDSGDLNINATKETTSVGNAQNPRRVKREHDVPDLEYAALGRWERFNDRCRDCFVEDDEVRLCVGDRGSGEGRSAGGR
jgi:hypothetical protein